MGARTGVRARGLSVTEVSEWVNRDLFHRGAFSLGHDYCTLAMLMCCSMLGFFFSKREQV